MGDFAAPVLDLFSILKLQDKTSLEIEAQTTNPRGMTTGYPRASTGQIFHPFETIHEHDDDSFDTELIKARRKTQLEIECSQDGLNAGKSTCLSIPAPKAWRRSSKNQARSSKPYNDTAKLQPAYAQECSAPVHENASTLMLAQFPANATNPSCHSEDFFDTELIKARRKTQLEIESLSVGTSTCLPIPAPKVWRRSSKKQACSTLTVDAAKLQLAHTEQCTSLIHEIDASNIDEWTRDFLRLVIVNES